MELKFLCSFFFWREEDAAEVLLFLLPLERDAMEMQSLFRKKRKIGAEAAADPSSSEGRGKVELNSLFSFFFWREEDGAVFRLSFWKLRNMELKAY